MHIFFVTMPMSSPRGFGFFVSCQIIRKNPYFLTNGSIFFTPLKDDFADFP